MALIEREAFRRELLSLTYYGNGDYYIGREAERDAIIERLNKQPTIDAAPVVHGRWVEYMPFLGAGDLQSHCSACGLTNDVRTPYCPNCGARMDGGKDDAKA